MDNMNTTQPRLNNKKNAYFTYLQFTITSTSLSLLQTIF